VAGQYIRKGSCYRGLNSKAGRSTSEEMEEEDGIISTASPKKLSQSAMKQTSLSSYSAARDLPHDQMKQDNRGKTNLQERNALPDIHSSDGRPLVNLGNLPFPLFPIGIEPGLF